MKRSTSIFIKTYTHTTHTTYIKHFTIYCHFSAVVVCLMLQLEGLDSNSYSTSTSTHKKKKMLQCMSSFILFVVLACCNKLHILTDYSLVLLQHRKSESVRERGERVYGRDREINFNTSSYRTIASTQTAAYFKGWQAVWQQQHNICRKWFYRKWNSKLIELMAANKTNMKGSCTEEKKNTI